MITIQSISDLITNSSTEVFIVYDESNINDIKELVNAVLSLEDPSKTFDDYFTIEMLPNYDSISYAFEYLFDSGVKDYPEVQVFNDLDSWEEERNYLESLPIDTLKEIVDRANDESWYSTFRLYEGYSVVSKTDDLITRKVAGVLNAIDTIFSLDYSSD